MLSATYLFIVTLERYKVSVFIFWGSPQQCEMEDETNGNKKK